MLLSVDCYLTTDVAGQPNSPIFKGQSVSWRWDREVIPKRHTA